MNDQQRNLIDQLQQLGYQPELVNNRVVFDFEVHTGQCQGRTVRVGLDADSWPSTPSHWIHVHGPFTDGGNVRQSEIGPQWRKFSRNFNDWRKMGADIRALIAHLHRVFEHVTSEQEGDAVA